MPDRDPETLRAKVHNGRQAQFGRLHAGRPDFGGIDRAHSSAEGHGRGLCRDFGRDVSFFGSFWVESSSSHPLIILSSYESGAFYGAEARHKEKKDSTIKREAYFLEFAEQCRRAVPNFCLMVTGGFRSRTGMGAALRSGSCDLIGLGRPACIDPDLPLRILQTSDLVPDVRCVDYDPDGRVKDKRARGVDVMAHTAQMRRIALGLEPDPKMDIVDLLEGSKGDWLHLTQVYGKPESNGVWKL